MKVYTTKTAAPVLGVKQDTVKHYALRFGIGFQPGGPGTGWLFTIEDLVKIREKARELSIEMGTASARRYERIEEQEDRDELGMGPLYNPDASPRK